MYPAAFFFLLLLSSTREATGVTHLCDRSEAGLLTLLTQSSLIHFTLLSLSLDQAVL